MRRIGVSPHLRRCSVPRLHDNGNPRDSVVLLYFVAMTWINIIYSNIKCLHFYLKKSTIVRSVLIFTQH